MSYEIWQQKINLSMHWRDIKVFDVYYIFLTWYLYIIRLFDNWLYFILIFTKALLMSKIIYIYQLLSTKIILVHLKSDSILDFSLLLPI